MSCHLTLARLTEILTEERIAELDPPLPDENYTPILPPSPLPTRVYHQEGIDELSIQRAMEMEDKHCEFMYLMLLIRHTAKSYTDINIRYSRQGSEVLRRIKREVLDLAPIFYNYEYEWPITAYLRSAMKGHYRSDARTPVPPSPRSPAPAPSSGRATLPPNHAFVMVPTRGESIVSYASETEDLFANPVLNTRVSCPRSHPQIKVPEPSQGSSSDLRSSRGSIPPSSQTTTYISSSASSTAHSPPATTRYASTHTLETVSRETSAHSRAAPPPPESIVARLVACALPRADAEHLAQVLVSLGVTDASYLRVFGKMLSRDVWLEELRVEGQLTEIQVRVVRELVERAAAED